ncbi:MAG: hypothetical protein FWB96_00350 [Defluviitaleaceae bacterium]|nr:hypothetical protein [Defluviitaleaceae bacterium]MCL2261838.1 hypothetical protein [Defluviitaleaceae bacterium]
MKRKSASLYFVSTLILCTIMVVSSNSNTHYYVPLIDEQQALDDEMFDRDMGVVGYAQNHRNASQTRSLIRETFAVSRSGEIIFPNFYGGSGFDENGHLEFWIVESEADVARSKLGHIDFSDATIKYVEFSSNYLIDTLYVLDDLFFDENRNLNELAYGVVRAWGITPRKNVVFVTLDTYNAGNDAIIDLVNASSISTNAVFFEFMDFNPDYCPIWNVPIEVENFFPSEEEYVNEELFQSEIECAEPFMSSFYLAPGARVYCAVMSDHGGSVGFRARRNGQPGFVTAAHVFTLNNANVVAATTGVIGRVNGIAPRYVDASFVATRVPPDFQVTISNRLPGFGGTYNATLFDDRGWSDALVAFGRNSTSHRLLTIHSLRVRQSSMRSPIYVIEDAILVYDTNNRIGGGDSGGLVIYRGNRSIAGLIVGSHGQGAQRRVVISNARHIVNRLGLTLF